MRYILVLSTMVLLGMAGFAADEKSEPKAGDIKFVDVGGGMKMDFVWCPPGEFVMGSGGVVGTFAMTALRGEP